MQTSSIILTADEIQAIQRMRAQIGMRATARRLGVGADTLYRSVKKFPLYRGTATQIRLGLRLHAAAEPQP